MAVGATAGAIARLVVADALRVVAVGAAAGGGLVLLLGTIIGSRIPFVDLADPRVYALTIGIIVATSMVAAAVPAWRAARLDPDGVVATRVALRRPDDRTARSAPEIATIDEWMR